MGGPNMGGEPGMNQRGGKMADTGPRGGMPRASVPGPAYMRMKELYDEAGAIVDEAARLAGSRDTLAKARRLNSQPMTQPQLGGVPVPGDSVLGLLWTIMEPVMLARSLTIKQAAERLGLSKRKFDLWRKTHPNHPHHRVDRRVFYTLGDILAIEQQWQRGIAR